MGGHKIVTGPGHQGKLEQVPSGERCVAFEKFRGASKDASKAKEII